MLSPIGKEMGRWQWVEGVSKMRIRGGAIEWWAGVERGREMRMEETDVVMVVDGSVERMWGDEDGGRRKGGWEMRIGNPISK